MSELMDYISRLETREDLKCVYSAYRTAYDAIDARAKLSFYKNQKVSFIHKDVRQEGYITKINKKTIKVQVGTMIWTCNPSSLTAVETIYHA